MDLANLVQSYEMEMIPRGQRDCDISVLSAEMLHDYEKVVSKFNLPVDKAIFTHQNS